jgi:hypothetical protein
MMLPFYFKFRAETSTYFKEPHRTSMRDDEELFLLAESVRRGGT